MVMVEEQGAAMGWFTWRLGRSYEEGGSEVGGFW